MVKIYIGQKEGESFANSGWTKIKQELTSTTTRKKKTKNSIQYYPKYRVF